MDTPKKIVITGGPGGGKTTTLNSLKTRSDLCLVPEAATILLESGYPSIGPEQPWTPTWQQGLQIAVMGLQKGLELLANENGSSKRAILYDRGIADSAAYLQNTAEFEKLSGETLEQSFDRYDAVIFLHSFAKQNQYQQLSNAIRFEQEAQARETNDKLLNIWKQHPKCIEVNCLTERPRTVERIIDGMLQA